MRRLLLSTCLLLAGTLAFADEVVITGGGSESVVLVDATYPSGCISDQQFSATGPTPVDIGNADSVDGCRDELIVAAPSGALAVMLDPDFSPVNANFSVSLTPRLTVPVFTWAPRREPLSDADKVTLIGLSESDLIDADLAFGNARSGVAFEHQGISFPVHAAWVRRLEEAARQAAAGEADGQSLLDTLAECPQDECQPKSEGINVYRLDVPIRGFHIGLADNLSSGVIVLGTIAAGSTLGHELGHAMSLDHVNFEGVDRAREVSGEYCHAFGNPDYYDGECDFTELNLMWAGGGENRHELTLGQAVRVSVNTRSFLNSHRPPLRDLAAPRRDCPDWRDNAACPYIGMEAVP